MPRVEVVVVGAGIHGASLAFNLVKRDAGKVVLVEKAATGSGATGRSASFLRHHYSNEICVRIVQESLRIIRRWGKEVGGEVDFAQNPLLLMAGPEHEEGLRENVAMHRSLGVTVDLMEKEDASEAYPYLDLHGVSLTALERDAGYGDAYQMNATYVARFKDLGGKFLPSTRVDGILTEGGRVQGVLAEKERITAESVVVAAGPWSREVAATAGIDLPVHPALLAIGVLLPSEPLSGVPMAFDMTTGTYWRPEKAGTLLVGADEEVGGKWDPDDLPEGVGFDFVASIAAKIGQRWPAMKEARFVRGWVGADGATPDLHPIIGTAPGVEGLYLSTGYSGHGFKFSSAVGKCLAELILDGRYGTLDLSPFSLERFEAGSTFQSRYPMAVVQ